MARAIHSKDAQLIKSLFLAALWKGTSDEYYDSKIFRGGHRVREAPSLPARRLKNKVDCFGGEMYHMLQNCLDDLVGGRTIRMTTDGTESDEAVDSFYL